MIRRRAPASILAVALAAAVGLGCGAGDSTDGTSGASAEALARVRAAEFARGVNLRASDVPYFEVQPDEEEDPREKRRQDRELQKCIGVGDAEESLATVDSPTYGTESPGEFLDVASSVDIVGGAGEAARQLRFVRSRRAESCMQSVYAGALRQDESSTAEVRGASVARVRFPAPGIQDSFAYRFTASVTVHAPTSQLSAYRPAAEPGCLTDPEGLRRHPRLRRRPGRGHPHRHRHPGAGQQEPRAQPARRPPRAGVGTSPITSWTTGDLSREFAASASVGCCGFRAARSAPAVPLFFMAAIRPKGTVEANSGLMKADQESGRLLCRRSSP